MVYDRVIVQEEKEMLEYRTRGVTIVHYEIVQYVIQSLEHLTSGGREGGRDINTMANTTYFSSNPFLYHCLKLPIMRIPLLLYRCIQFMYLFTDTAEHMTL